MDEFLVKIREHRDEFYRYVRRNVWDSGVADDVFSAAVLAAYENRHKYTPGTNFRAWMFRILTNKCFVANRETARTPAPLDDGLDHFIGLEDDPGYGDVLEDPQRFLEACGDEVYRAMRSLSTAQRSCILLKDVEGFTYQEIADTLQIPAGTVMTHLSRGRTKLRRELLEYARAQGIVRDRPKLRVRKKDDEASGGTNRSARS